MDESNKAYKDPLRDILLSAACFIVSTLLTWRFINYGSDHYDSEDQAMLSASIAGTKWGIQVIAAIIFLKISRWGFIRRISVVCLLGSVALLPYTLFEDLHQKSNSFFTSLIFSVVLMIPLYYLAVRRTKLSLSWFIGWLICLAIAITLQLTVVFDII